MTYEYKLDNFLSTPLSGDQRLIINNKNNIYVDSITTDISHYFVKNNCLVIKIINKNDIILSFDSKTTAQQALTKLDDFRRIILMGNGNLNRNNYPTFNTMNRNMRCLDITPGIDFQLALTDLVAQQPRSRVEVIVNGSSHVSCGKPPVLGNVDFGCYFVPNGAGSSISNARVNDGDVQLGDQLYWIGSVATFYVDSTDWIDYDFLF